MGSGEPVHTRLDEINSHNIRPVPVPVPFRSMVSLVESKGFLELVPNEETEVQKQKGLSVEGRWSKDSEGLPY